MSLVLPTAFEVRVKQAEQLSGKAKDNALKTLSVVCDNIMSLVETE
jgi:hypothetical protein